MTLSKEQKIAKAKELHLQGFSARAIGRELTVHHTTVLYWVDPQFKAKKLTEASTPKGLERHRNNQAKQRGTPQGQAYQQTYMRGYLPDYRRKRLKADPQYKLAVNLRKRLWQTLQNHTNKVGSAVRDLGCSVEFLKQHLESQFQVGMTWENYGHWHIDHKKPLASFDLTDRKQFLEVCHYTNLRPLWAKENISKGARC